ncbi:formate/nitrite transporter family protein, partial [bacterium]
MSAEIQIDSLIPSEMARKAETVGTAKANAGAFYLFVLAVLAGAFIAMGAMFATTVLAGGITISAPDGAKAFSAAWPYGVTRMLGGLAFSLGLIMVVVGGAELFTGNSLMIIAWMDRKITLGSMLRNWSIVYLGNFAGALLLVALVFLSGEYRFGGGLVGETMLNMALMKLDYGFGQALVLGILCNILVCLAVWLTYSARSTVGKILAILFPITAFVAAGFEHSVANMYA